MAKNKRREPPEPPAPDPKELVDLLEYLRVSRGFDFTAYKRTTLTRRMQRRMQTIGIESYTDYKDYLEVHPEEFGLLFNSFLINVTTFFRDPGAWDYLSSDVIPRLLASVDKSSTIRVWSAGCSTGEEPYSLAILLVEAVGIEQFRSRVKIYATDVDEEALTYARQASYTAAQVGEVPKNLVERYFELQGDRYLFRKDLRRSVIFGRHDLIQDAPISHIDLLVCRNTLMYFNLETQSRVLARFHFALEDTGILFLGKVEMLLARNANFTPIDLSRRVFGKVRRDGARDRMALHAQTTSEPAFNGPVRLREAALDASVVPQIVIDAKGTLVMANESARRAFKLDAPDVGRLLQDLQISYRPVELRSHIDRCTHSQQPILLQDLEIESSDGKRWLDMHFTPLLSLGQVTGVSVQFVDVTRSHAIQTELFRSNQELETAQEELHSTNEELETTNEELQSTVEELETTNEELQSTNEELETMNEELQSTNDELRLINDQLQLRTNEINKTTAFLQAVLTSLRHAVIVVDPDLRIQAWNKMAEDLWGMRLDEVRGQKLTALDIGLPVHSLRDALHKLIDGKIDGDEREFKTNNRRGKQFTCRVSVSPLMHDGRIEGAVIIMEDGVAPSAH